MSSDDFLTVPEVAERLRVRTMTIYRWIEAGKLPALQVGKHYRIRTSDLEAMLEGSRVTVERDDPWGAEPAGEPEHRGMTNPAEQRRQAIAMNDAAAMRWAEAMQTHMLAPPDARFPVRLRGLADAARDRARAARVADAAGLKWVAQPGALQSQPPYELRPNTGRTGPAELWERFDAAVVGYNQAIAGTAAGAVADAADALADVAEQIASAHERAPGESGAAGGSTLA
jgi:excisionase family DNA binding protein